MRRAEDSEESRGQCVVLLATHCSVPALQQRPGVAQQQTVVRVHHVGLGLRLVSLLLRLRVVEGLLVVLVKGDALKASEMEIILMDKRIIMYIGCTLRYCETMNSTSLFIHCISKYNKYKYNKINKKKILKDEFTVCHDI